MRIFTIAALSGLSLMGLNSAAYAQGAGAPDKQVYELYKLGDVDGSKAPIQAKPYFMEHPSAGNAATVPAKTLFITSPMPAGKNIDLSTDKGVQAMAYDFLNSISGRLGIANVYQSFTPVFTQTDELGMSHVKMQQMYNGVPVFATETFVHLKQGQDGIVNGKCISNDQLSMINVTPTIADNTAEATALAHIKGETRWENLSADAQRILHYTTPEKELVIFQDFHDASRINLAWHFTIRPNAIERWEYFVDAHTGDILYHYDNTCSDGPVTGQGTDALNLTRSLQLYQVGSTYYMIDASRSMFNSGASSFPNAPAGAIRTVDARNTDISNVYNITSTTNSFWPDNSSVSAHYQAGICYDYYEKTFGRKGLDGMGGTMLSVVNVTAGGQKMDNAYWNGQLMAYGNGNVLFSKPLAAALDVTGHEMTHGVVQSTANLTYQDQSGAINESMADVFGVLIDRSNWTIGEKVVNISYFPSGALRDLEDPHNGGSGPGSSSWQPAKMSEYVVTTADHGGVHVNSGIPNFAFYKIATAVSKDTAEKIYYRALTLYLTRSSQFIDLRLSVAQAAADLYGPKSKEVTVVNNAFDAVQIYNGTGNDFQKNLPPVYGSDFLMVHAAPYKDSSLYLVKPSKPGANDYHNITQLQALNRPSITDDGQRGYFINMNNQITKLAVDTLKYRTSTINFSGFNWNNVAISKDSTKLALTRIPNDTSIYILDIRNLSNVHYVRYHLFNPTYASGIQTGGPVYANTLEWDPSGQYVMYDSYNQIGSGSTKINYWDVGFLKAWDTAKAKNTFGDGTITKLFASLPRGIDITNPAYSKNSPYIVTYDYYDETTKSNKIYASNIEHGFDSAIFANNTLGYPTFSKNDDYLAFTSINTKGDTIIAEIPLHANKMSAAGSASTLLVGYKWPVWYTRGLRSGIQALYNTIGPKICEFSPNAFYSTSLGKVKTYSWSFGANSTPSTSTASGPINVVYSKPGNVTITLTVKDSAGKSSVYTTNAFVYAGPTLSIAEGTDHVLTVSSTLTASNIQWYFNGKPISGANSKTYTPINSGDYTVSATATTGCSNTSPAYHFVNAGIDAQYPLVQANVYPNPSTGLFNLEFEMGSAHDLHLSITNLLGQDMYQHVYSNSIGLHNETLDLTHLPAGIYVLKLNAGSSVYTQQIMISK